MGLLPGLCLGLCLGPGLGLIGGCSVPQGTGPDGGGPGKLYSAFAGQAIAAILQYEERCGLLDPSREPQRKEVLLAGSFASALSAMRDQAAGSGLVSYDSTCVPAALSATAPCQATLVQTTLSACATSLGTGTLAAGANCQLPEECKPGTFCQGIPQGVPCGVGKCTPTLPIGSLCPEGNLACDPKLAVCNQGGCIARVSAGSPCQQDFDCLAGLSCIKPSVTSSEGQCTPSQPIASGGACVPQVGQPCGAGLACFQNAQLNYVCQAVVQTGQPCRTTESCAGTDTCVRQLLRQGAAVHYGGTAFAASTTGTGSSLYGVWSSAPTDVWAVGDSGAILHYSGTAWSAVASPVTSLLRAVWGSAANNVWAVGDSGVILHWNGTSWSQSSSGTVAGLRGVSGSGSTAWAVGDNGTILLNTGAGWGPSSTTATASLNSVFAVSATEAWAVGEMGTVIHYTGGAWAAPTSATSAELFSVWGSGAADVWAVGAVAQGSTAGTILHSTGGAFAANPSAPEQTLSAVWGSGANDVWMVGSAGAVLHYTGAAFTPVQSATAVGLQAVWGSGAADLWVVGQQEQPLGKCQPLGKPGASCSVDQSLGAACQGTLRCYNFNGGTSALCTAQPDTGGECDANLQCLLGRCGLTQAQPTCLPPIGAGLGCAHNEDCQSGVCNAATGTCQALACM